MTAALRLFAQAGLTALLAPVTAGSLRNAEAAVRRDRRAAAERAEARAYAVAAPAARAG